MNEIVVVPMSYLEYYHNESVTNPHYSSDEKIRKQQEIIKKLESKKGVGEDNEVALKKSDLRYFQLS